MIIFIYLQNFISLGYIKILNELINSIYSYLLIYLLYYSLLKSIDLLILILGEI